MMALSEYLDDFGIAKAGPISMAPVIDEAEFESKRLESFENGYRAGWDDAIKAQSDDKTRISSAFGQHLQDLSFTYHEAYSHVMNAMTPLLDDLVGVLLPKTARAALGQHVLDQLHGLARDVGSLEVVIAVAPCNRDAVEPLIAGEFSFPVRLIEDDTLSEEQADIRFGATERQIDLSALADTVTEALEGFTHDNQRSVANG